MIEAGLRWICLGRYRRRLVQHFCKRLLIEARSRRVCSVQCRTFTQRLRECLIKAGRNWSFATWFAEKSRESCVVKASERLLGIGRIQVWLAERLRKDSVIKRSLRNYCAGCIQVCLVKHARKSLVHRLEFIRAHSFVLKAPTL